MKKLPLIALLVVAVAIGAVWYTRGTEEVPEPPVTELGPVAVTPEPDATECRLDLSGMTAPEGWSYREEEANCLAIALPDGWDRVSTNGHDVTYGANGGDSLLTVTVRPSQGDEAVGYRLIDGDVDNDAMPGFRFHDYVGAVSNGNGGVINVLVAAEESTITEDEFVEFAGAVLNSIKN